MRERLAIGISLLAVLLLVTLATLFAASQNREGRDVPLAAALHEEPGAAAGRELVASEPEVIEAAQQAQADSVRGRAVFRSATCERCHSVEGVGSRRYPLDGVGARRTRAQLRAWTIAEGAVLDSLSPSAARAKQPYAELPRADMEALLHYMSTLVTEP